MIGMPIKIPEAAELQGEEAIRALSDAIAKLEEQKGNQLTGEQTEVSIKIAKGMISFLQKAKIAGGGSS